MNAENAENEVPLEEKTREEKLEIIKNLADYLAEKEVVRFINVPSLGMLQYENCRSFLVAAQRCERLDLESEPLLDANLCMALQASCVVLLVHETHCRGGNCPYGMTGAGAVVGPYLRYVLGPLVMQISEAEEASQKAAMN